MSTQTSDIADTYARKAALQRGIAYVHLYSAQRHEILAAETNDRHVKGLLQEAEQLLESARFFKRMASDYELRKK